MQDPTVCSGVDSSNTISVTVTPGSYNGTDKINAKVKIKVSGIAGVRRNSIIKYKWSTSNVDFNTNGMQNATFNNVPTEETQREMLSAGNIISLDSVEIITPAEMSGRLYFILYSDNLRDLHDNYWSYNDSNYLVFGPYQVEDSCASTKMVCDPWGSYGDCSRPCAGGTMQRTRFCRYISTYDERTCGSFTETETSACNREACAPYIVAEPDKSVGLVSYTCDTNDPFVTSRECDVIWDGPGGYIYQRVERSPDYGNNSWKHWCLENGKTVPYCDWESECGGFPSNNSVLKTRVNQDAFSLLGGITIYNNSHK